MAEATCSAERTTTACDGCGTVFVAHNPRKRYCTDACQRRHHRLGYRGPNFLHLGDTDIGRYYDAIARDPCAYCGLPHEHLDHIVSQRRGGENQWTNYTSACATCNSSKGGDSLLAFLIRRPLLEQRRALDTTLRDWVALRDPIVRPKQRRSRSMGRARTRVARGGG